MFTFIPEDYYNSPEYTGPRFNNEAEEMEYFTKQCQEFICSGVSSLSIIGQILGIHPDWVALLLYLWGGVSKGEIVEKYGYKLEGDIVEVIV